MTGRQALSARLNGGSIEGCSELESMACEQFASCLAKRAAGVISGVKPGSLFNFVLHAPASQTCDCLHCANKGACKRRALREAMRATLRGSSEGMGNFGIRLVVLYWADNKVMLLAYSPERCAKILADPDVRSFVAARGYDATDVDSFVTALRSRIASYHLAHARGCEARYPHEIGLLLGYPLEDVSGFIAGEKETLRGPWKAYGDPARARARFRRIAACEDRCWQRFVHGESIASLLERPVVAA